MPTSKAQQKAVSKYMKQNYDVYQIRMPKGQKGVIKAHADSRNESVNGFIQRAISQTMEQDTAISAAPTPSQPLSDTQPAPASTPAPEATETPQDGVLLLVERGSVNPELMTAQHLYTEKSTNREYYVEPVIPDDEWEALNMAKQVDGDEDSLPF